jgi:hypothetical protein
MAVLTNPMPAESSTLKPMRLTAGCDSLKRAV